MVVLVFGCSNVLIGAMGFLMCFFFSGVVEVKDKRIAKLELERQALKGMYCLGERLYPVVC